MTQDDNVGNDLAWVGANEDEPNKGKGKGQAAKGKRGGKTGRGRGASATRKDATRSPAAEDGESADRTQWSYLIQRAKIVRADFLPLEDPDVTHWSRQMLVKNIVRYA